MVKSLNYKNNTATSSSETYEIRRKSYTNRFYLLLKSISLRQLNFIQTESIWISVWISINIYSIWIRFNWWCPVGMKSLVVNKSSGNLFVSGTFLTFKPQASQIGHSVAKGSPPQWHFFERSCVAWGNDAEMGPPTRYTFQPNTASVMKDLIKYTVQWRMNYDWFRMFPFSLRI